MLEKFLIVLAVAAFIRRDDGALLIVKKAPGEKVDGGLWTIPGGKVDPDEYIIDALKRETKEECNLDIMSQTWLDEDVFQSGGQYFHGHHFLCTVSNPDDVTLEPNLTAYQWITAEQVDDFEFHPNIRKEIISLFNTHECECGGNCGCGR